MAKIIVEQGDVLTRIEAYRKISALFLLRQLPKNLLWEYLYGEDEDVIFEIQEFIADNLKDNIKFSISIPILDCIELLVQENEKNGNIRIIEDEKRKS